MHTLEKMFPSLTLFSDLDWAAVTQEYEADYIDLSFPEYLQQKALDGDCPLYLFELAFYELALFDAKSSNEAFPHQSGVYLNPTALFLSLEFDVKRMLDEAKKGIIEVHERPNVICIFRDTKDALHIEELSEESLDLLQHLEDGPAQDSSFASNKSLFDKLVKSEIVITIP